jgi:ribosomal protein S18 acetylase RimI-like enzyme
VHPDQDALVAIVEGTVSPPTRSELYAVLEQMGSYHPTEPHWYLPLIPLFQSKGCGGALLRFALKRFDAEGRVAYLESTNPRNISLYKRHGFEELGEIQIGTSPTVVPMARQPS